MELLPGTYNYNFDFIVPLELPTSYEGEFGHIRYTLRVGLDIPMRPVKEFEELFTVIRPIDLNYNPSLSVILLLFSHFLLVFMFIDKFFPFLDLYTIHRSQSCGKASKHLSFVGFYAVLNRNQWQFMPKLQLGVTHQAKPSIWNST